MAIQKIYSASYLLLVLFCVEIRASPHRAHHDSICKEPAIGMHLGSLGIDETLNVAMRFAQKKSSNTFLPFHFICNSPQRTG
jgi:hypothetical protein